MARLPYFKLSMLVVLFILPSCIPYYKLVKSEFPQGKDYNDNREFAFNYIRSKSVFDSFTTLAAFDALWLSDDVRAAYVGMCGRSSGLSSSKKAYLQKEQLEENRRKISFYLLADIRDKAHYSMADKHSIWKMHLKTADGQKVEAEIKDIEPDDLEPEFREMFGHRFELSKSIYLVQFPAYGPSGKYYLNNQFDFSLVISSAKKKTSLKWVASDYKERSELGKDEDFYWS